ncbi:Hypothetical protein NTJ_11981 [Nesidiocoris tenuis]|uniref:Peptidase A2 domain-containing protein n=1 Tax=Nesidiocoris tenuis TaxID=355587 RepID=A0ABN7B6E2_9HEMI|nr:Hypothetical protein NTJ_11981 [Nesidiocoris tenuis]
MFENQQQQNIAMMGRMLSEVLATFKESTTAPKPIQKMEIPKFDGKVENPESWITLYERACQVNNWTSDESKINNLLGYLVPQSTAQKWYFARMASSVIDADWRDWKMSFVDAFGQNDLHLAKAANAFVYSGGALMDYWYEKSRLVQLAYGPLPDKAMNIMLALGLPEFMQSQVSLFNFTTTEEMRSFVTKLKPLSFKSSRLETTNDTSPSAPSKKFIHTQGNFKNPRFVNSVEASQDNGHDREEDGEIKVISSYSCCSFVSPVHPVRVNGVIVKALFDTGANADLVNNELISRFSWKVSPAKQALLGFNGSKEYIEYSTLLTLQVEGSHKVTSEAFVTGAISHEMIIGMPTLTPYILPAAYRRCTLLKICGRI